MSEYFTSTMNTDTPVRFLLQKINAKPNFFHQIPLIDAIIVLASDIFCLNYQNSHKKRKRTHGSDTEFFR